MVPDTFGTVSGIDLVDLLPFRNGAVRALRLAHIAIDTFVSNQKSHGYR
jgi:hypothetical protein